MSINIINASLKKWILLFFFSSLQLLCVAQQEGDVVIPGLYRMPETNIENAEEVIDSRSGVREDLHKFMGYEALPARYLSMPFDVFINNNLNYIFTDVGFLLLLILPILFLLPYKNDPNKSGFQKALLSLTMMVLYALLLIISVPSAYLNKHNLRTPQEGLNLLKTTTNTGVLENTNIFIKKSLFQLYNPFHQCFSVVSGDQDAITYPILLILFIGLLVVVIFRIQRHSKITKTMILFLTTYSFLWWILGSGAPWYGILLFCVPYIFLVRGIRLDNSKKLAFSSIKNISATNIKSSILITVCFFWVLMAFAFRSSNYTPANKENGKNIYIQPIIQYQNGKLDEKSLLNAHLPNYHEVKSIINQDDKSLVYRVGTLLNYFIKKNDRRVFNDTFLDFFGQMANRFKSKEKIIQVLKASGFKYIIVDLNMASNDFTPEKSLTRKMIQFMNGLYNNPGVELMVTNRTIKLNSTGQVVYGVFEDQGVIVNKGSIALFRIK